jgi:hypothetical protein
VKTGKKQILKSVGQLTLGLTIFLILVLLFIYWQSSGYRQYVIYVQVKDDAIFNNALNSLDPHMLDYGRKYKKDIIAMDNDIDSGDGPKQGKLRWYVGAGIDCDEGWENRFIKNN